MAPMIEKQMDKSMANEMEAGVILGLYEGIEVT